MTLEEKIAVLKEHRSSIAGCYTFEAFKCQQLAFIDFLIEDTEIEVATAKAEEAAHE